MTSALLRLLVCAFAACTLAAGAGPLEFAQSIQALELDPAECYRVRDISIVRDEARTFLTDGLLIFAKAVDGHRVAAVFTAEVEGGDAELLLMPPTKAERKSLARFAKAPNLEEHFRAGLLLFGDGTYAELMRQIQEGETNRKAPGETLATDWTPVARRLASSFSTRLALELLSSPAANGFFTEVLSTRNLGTIDVIYDPRSTEQIVLGQLQERSLHPFFETWTSFEGKSFRQHPATPEISIDHYQIDADLDPQLHLRCASTITMHVSPASARGIPLEVSAQMHLTKATVDGHPAIILDSTSLVSEMLADARDRLFIVVPDQPLDTAMPHEVRIEHDGDVISAAAGGIFFVGSRGRWYPHRGAQFSSFDVTYRYASNLDLVSAGELVSDTAEGNIRTVRRRLTVPVPFLGFNIGNYRCVEHPAQNVAIKVCATNDAKTPPEPTTKSPDRLETLATEIGDALTFYHGIFGPPPLKDLVVSPIPGTFGQGFAGLIYLAANTYAAPDSPEMTRLDPSLQFFYQNLLAAHELAHQWWGNTVSAATYRDEWLMEALANYSAILWLEQRKGTRSTSGLLENYRNGLLSKGANGQSIESTGPMTLGHRLESPENMHAYDLIVYGKGTWVIHMLRSRMGDEAFLRVLQQLLRDYRHKQLSTAQFRQICAAAMPKDAADRDLEAFFDQWVNGTGIPDLKISSSVKAAGGGWKVSGTIEQSDVEDDFQTEVPVQVQFGRGKSVTRWVTAASEPAKFTIDVPAKPVSVMLDPNRTILQR